MTLSDLDKLLLLSVLTDRDTLTSQSPIWQIGAEDRHEFARRRCAIQDARQGIVRIRWPDWLGHATSNAERHAGCRAVKKLMAAGLIIGHGDRQINFLELTEVGEKLANEISNATTCC
jgi:hypothetical protein